MINSFLSKIIQQLFCIFQIIETILLVLLLIIIQKVVCLYFL